MKPIEEIQKLTDKEVDENIEEYIETITEEFREGFKFLKKYPKTVSIFGSARLTPASSHFDDAKKLAGRIVKELGYSIITGGGPGIMEATNQGAHEAKGDSIGFDIELPNEQNKNAYVLHSVHFRYFFARKAMLTFSAEAFVFFPGGFGTFDELFSILTLIQTNKIPRVPVILFGKDFWQPLKEFINAHMLTQHHTISPEDMNSFVVTDSTDATIKIIKDAKVSEWWNHLG